MNDIFIEQLVKKEKTKIDLIKKILGVMAAIIVLMICLQFEALYLLVLPILLVEVIAIRFLFIRMNIEYEYIITNDSLDIDIIYNQQKRKHIETINIKNIQIMAQVSNQEYANEMGKYDKLKDYSSQIPTDNTYGVIVKNGQVTSKVIIEPNEMVLKAIKRYIPRQVK
jgi:hypothetical protein